MAQSVTLGANGVARISLSQRAWRFYGATVANYETRSNCGAVGEVRYVLGWIAEQVGRVGWHVTVDGKQLTGEDLETTLKRVANPDTTVQLATNLVVAGELHYAAFNRAELRASKLDAVLQPVAQALMDAGPSLPRADDAVWLPISSVYPHRAAVLEKAKLKVRGVWPNPANPVVPDPPLFGVLDVLEEIEQLQDLAWAQNRSRLAQTGFLEIAKEYSFIGEDNGSAFHARMEEAINTRMLDPRGTGAAPITVTAPQELIGKGIAHTPIQVDPDRQLESKMRFAIQRLAWGFPVPPEILLGMTSTNRATAYQIEESTYKAHIEPLAKLVGRVYANALAQLIDSQDPDVEVVPDPTNLLARQQSVPDLQWAYINGLINRALVLRAMGVDPDDSTNLSTDEDIERLLILRYTSNEVKDQETEPDAAEQPAVRASGAVGADLDGVTEQLAKIDEVLLTQLEVAAERDVEAALRRLGAQCRTKLRQEGPTAYERRGLAHATALRNHELPFALGVDRIRELGVDHRATLAGSLMGLGDWWQHTALLEARENTRNVLLPLGATLPPANGAYARSTDELVNGLVDWLDEELQKPEATLSEVPVLLLRDVVSTAGRG